MPLQRIAVIGSGPAGLMAATKLCEKYLVEIHEKNSGPGQKFLIAGASGLNVAHSLPTAEFIQQYEANGFDIAKALRQFSPAHWLGFIESMGCSTFLGTSGRWFLQEMKSSSLLRRWISHLKNKNVIFRFNSEITKIRYDAVNQIAPIGLETNQNSTNQYNAVLLALGGGSWQRKGKKATWPELLKPFNIGVGEFAPANCGYHAQLPGVFLQKHARTPLKNVELITSKGRKKGDLLITEYGFEGTPVYTMGITGPCALDIKPDLTVSEIASKLSKAKENLSPLRRLKKNLNLQEAALDLVAEYLKNRNLTYTKDYEFLAKLIKEFPIGLLQPRPLAEAISSHGGLLAGETDENLMLKKLPGVFAAGEMLDWSAPTGGFLIQACVSQGVLAAQGIDTYLQSKL